MPTRILVGDWRCWHWGSGPCPTTGSQGPSQRVRVPHTRSTENRPDRSSASIKVAAMAASLRADGEWGWLGWEGSARGNEFECVAVAGPHDPEVTFVERGEHGDAEAFREGNY